MYSMYYIICVLRVWPICLTFRNVVQYSTNNMEIEAAQENRALCEVATLLLLSIRSVS